MRPYLTGAAPLGSGRYGVWAIALQRAVPAAGSAVPAANSFVPYAVDVMVQAGLLDRVLDQADAGELRLTGEGGFLPEW